MVRCQQAFRHVFSQLLLCSDVLSVEAGPNHVFVPRIQAAFSHTERDSTGQRLEVLLSGAWEMQHFVHIYLMFVSVCCGSIISDSLVRESRQSPR
jgi:hypothetical protein